jgi:hypothetical protein
MPRAVLVFCLTFGLVSVAGCFSRSTEPVKKEEGGNMDRLKGLRGGANPLTKGKGPAPKAGGDKGAPNQNKGGGV